MRIENMPQEIIHGITGAEMKALIEEPHITPLFLRGPGPAPDDNEGETREQWAISYGLRRLEGQGGVEIDGLHRGSPILLREFALRALEQNRRLLETAANYRQAEAQKVETMLHCGAFDGLDPLQGPGIAPLQPPLAELSQQPPILP